MRCFSFELVVNEEISEELTERLFEAGCDDGCVGACRDIWSIHFDREAESLELAIRSAMDSVRSVGLTISQVRLNEDEIASTFQESV